MVAEDESASRVLWGVLFGNRTLSEASSPRGAIGAKQSEACFVCTGACIVTQNYAHNYWASVACHIFSHVSAAGRAQSKYWSLLCAPENAILPLKIVPSARVVGCSAHAITTSIGSRKERLFLNVPRPGVRALPHVCFLGGAAGDGNFTQITPR